MEYPIDEEHCKGCDCMDCKAKDCHIWCKPENQHACNKYQVFGCKSRTK